ncbi:MAG: hypothetical protein V2J51_17825 [Erythrobacter sp.]|jgi:hypothetical protein|nr:hypothetical protein [Erythrobacter sp.]
MDDFTQFQLKEYENISQAHFKTNEVLATFYRYFLLIAAIPMTAVGIAMINLADNGIGDEGRLLGYIFFGVSTLLLSVIGAAVVSYIEGLRLDSILYARVVNSIRAYFFSLQNSEKFGKSVLPTDRTKPSYDGFGAGYTIYFACATLNASYSAVGVLALSLDHTTPLVDVTLTSCQWGIVAAAFVIMFGTQVIIRQRLLSGKTQKGF